MIGDLSLQLGWIGTVDPAWRQVKDARINIEEFPGSHVSPS